MIFPELYERQYEEDAQQEVRFLEEYNNDQEDPINSPPAQRQGTMRREEPEQQRQFPPENSRELTNEESQREISNCNIYRLMDFISIAATFYVINSNDICQAPYQRWYIANAALSLFSITYLSWYVNSQIRNNYVTKRAEVMTYVIETLFVINSIIAIHSFYLKVEGTEQEQCFTDTKRPTELLMDIVILNYMRSLRMVALISFIGMCGPILLLTYCISKPKSPVSAKKLNELFAKVTLKELYQLRERNYKHNMSSTPEQASQDDIETQISDNKVQDDDTCCICMDDFNAEEKDEAQVVILPCKAHYFHELCITEWMHKQNVCPVCRHEVTIENLTEQQKEVKELLREIKTESQF